MYTPTVWKTGDVVTAERLNKIEQGLVSGGVYTESEMVRFSGEATTTAQGSFNSATINCDLSDTPEQITVVFDGTEYTVSKVESDGETAYGGVDETGLEFSEYPFAVVLGTDYSILMTETASTHQVVIKVATETVNQDLIDILPVMRLIHNKTLSADAVKAFNDGKLLYYTYNGVTYIVTGIDGSQFTHIPENENAVCSIEDEYVYIGK